MKKKIVRLTEQDLHTLIKESVSQILKERFQPSQPDELTFPMEIEFPEDVTPNEEEAYKEIDFYCTYNYTEGSPQSFNDPGCDAEFDLLDVDFDKEGLTPEEIQYVESVWIEENWEELEEAAGNAFGEDLDNQYGRYEAGMEDRWDDYRHGI